MVSTAQFLTRAMEESKSKRLLLVQVRSMVEWAFAMKAINTVMYVALMNQIAAYIAETP